VKRSHVSIVSIVVLSLTLILIGGLAVPGVALAQEETSGPGVPALPPAELCQETYALCITAQCEEVETESGRMAECVCDVIENTSDSPAWSIGPGSCGERAPVEKDGRTILISTYSNLYNTGDNQVAECEEAIDWAWCYGAPCAVDPEDPTKAICNCPMDTSPTNILGPCDQDLCSNGLWSAATPADDCFANCHYYEAMQEHGGTNPPATTCSTGEPVCDCSSPLG
jgi:hypothetical protein